ncbi:unnamed protein product, partial [Symbiodinium necroappetens]
DQHIVRSPQILVPVMNSVTMHEALSKDPGNVVEQLTKLLGNLGGNFSVAKVEKDLAVMDRIPAAVQEEWEVFVKLSMTSWTSSMVLGQDRGPGRGSDCRDRSTATVMFKVGSQSRSVRFAMNELCQYLVSDSYGAVHTVRMARDAYNSRHCMHVVLSVPSTGGELWLGGIAASGQVSVLHENGISAVLAAAAKPPVAMDPNVKFLGCLDGTGVTTGTVSLTEVLKTFRDIVRILSGGGKVLISCKNGAHRSSLLVALFLMFTCGVSADEAADYLSIVRNIVDLASYPPRPKSGSSRPAGPMPLAWLREVETEVLDHGRALYSGWPFQLNKVEQYPIYGSTAKSKPAPKAMPTNKKARSGSGRSANLEVCARKRRMTESAVSKDQASWCNVCSDIECTEIETSGNEHSEVASASDWEKASLSKFSATSRGGPPAAAPHASLASVPEGASKIDQDDESGSGAAAVQQSEEDDEPEQTDDKVETDPDPDAADAAASQEWKPTKSMEEAVMGPDSDEVRAGHLAKLREMVSTLNDLDSRIKDTLGTPQQSPRASSAASGQVPVHETYERDQIPDWAADDEEEEEEEELARPTELPVASEGDSHPPAGPVASEEVTRLLDLMSEQQNFLQKLLDETAARQAEADQQRMVDSLLETIMSGDQAESLRVIATLRPQDLRDSRDLAGMTCLHHAVRVGDQQVIFQLLQKVPELANVPSSIRRNPPGWTPLMLIADKAPAETDQYVVGLLCASMTAEAFNNRSGTYATATHLAVARGNLPMVKKILWRMNDLGGRNLVVSHLKMQNQMARN